MSTNTETRDQDYPQTMHLGPNSGARVVPSYKTIRDEFAMVALTGLTATKAPVIAAGLAYEYADAMMAERSKTGEG